MSWPLRMGLLAAIWGCSFLFIKVGDEALAPFQVAFGRVLCGMVTLLVIMALSRTGLPRKARTWGHLAVAALFLNALPFSFFAYGETHVSAVVAGIWNATSALFTFPVALFLLPGEKARADRIAGLAVGFAGVLVVLGVWRGGLSGSSIEGNLLCLAAGLSYGVGIPYSRRFLSGRGDGPLALATGQLFMATFELAAVTIWFTSMPAELPARVVASVLILGAVGTGLAFVLNYSLVRDLGATHSSTVAYLIPIFSTLAGVLFLHERLAWNEPLGAVVILIGGALASGRLAGRARPPVSLPPGSPVSLPPGSPVSIPPGIRALRDQPPG